MRRRTKHRRYVSSSHTAITAAAAKDARKTSTVEIDLSDDDGDTVKTKRRSNSTSERSSKVLPNYDDEMQKQQTQILKMWDIEEVLTHVSTETEEELECTRVSSCSGTNRSAGEHVDRNYTKVIKSPVRSLNGSSISKKTSNVSSTSKMEETDLNKMLLTTLCAAIGNAQRFSEEGTEIEITLENSMACSTTPPQQANFIQKALLDFSCTKQQSVQPPSVITRIKVQVIPSKQQQQQQVFPTNERYTNKLNEYEGKD